MTQKGLVSSKVALLEDGSLSLPPFSLLPWSTCFCGFSVREDNVGIHVGPGQVGLFLCLGVVPTLVTSRLGCSHLITFMDMEESGPPGSLRTDSRSFCVDERSLESGFCCGQLFLAGGTFPGTWL